MTFLDVWVGYTIVGVILFTAVFLWAARTGQFSNLDRGRYIPLKAADQIDEPESPSREPSRIDRYTWVSLLVLAGAAGIVAILVAERLI